MFQHIEELPIVPFNAQDLVYTVRFKNIEHSLWHFGMVLHKLEGNCKHSDRVPVPNLTFGLKQQKNVKSTFVQWRTEIASDPVLHGYCQRWHLHFQFSLWHVRQTSTCLTNAKLASETFQRLQSATKVISLHPPTRLIELVSGGSAEQIEISSLSSSIFPFSLWHFPTRVMFFDNSFSRTLPITFLICREKQRSKKHCPWNKNKNNLFCTVSSFQNEIMLW